MNHKAEKQIDKSSRALKHKKSLFSTNAVSAPAGKKGHDFFLD